MFFDKTFTKNEVKVPYLSMTISQKISKKGSLEMKSEGHYKQAAQNYRKSKQYINMIGLYPVLHSTLLDCKEENLVE